MLKNSLLLFLLLPLLFFITASSSLAQRDQESSESPQKGTQEIIKKQKNATQATAAKEKIPLMIKYNDNDSLGRRLIFNLRERISQSEMFRLTDKNEKKIVLIIKSRDEFKGREGLASIYTAVWTFSYAQDVLSNYLQANIGFINRDRVKELTQSLLARTDEIYMQFSYLFEAD